MSGTRVESMRALLEREFHPVALMIRDDSAAHAGHAGARGGAGHYAIAIESEAFAGLPRLQRHRMIYEALSGMMPGEIHALTIDARAPQER